MNRQQGTLLLEALIGLTLLTVGLLGYLGAFASNLRAAGDVAEYDRARAALENAAEILRDTDFDNFYNSYNGSYLEAPGLKCGTCPYNAGIQVTCYVNEKALPSELGPIADLDGSGDLDNTNCAANYQILPIRLTLDFSVQGRSELINWYMVLRG